MWYYRDVDHVNSFSGLTDHASTGQISALRGPNKPRNALSPCVVEIPSGSRYLSESVFRRTEDRRDGKGATMLIDYIKSLLS